jgi:hypothetical protein
LQLAEFREDRAPNSVDVTKAGQPEFVDLAALGIFGLSLSPFRLTLRKALGRLNILESERRSPSVQSDPNQAGRAQECPDAADNPPANSVTRDAEDNTNHDTDYAESSEDDIAHGRSIVRGYDTS